MKRINFLFTIFIAATLLSCNKKLIEDPRSTLVPDALNTSQGIQMALDASYTGTRYLWGGQDYFTITVIGTDEFQTGIDGNKDISIYSSSFTTSDGRLNNVWRSTYTYINSCNAVVDNAPQVTGISKATQDRLIGEAKFLRANYYLNLVQLFGDVTLIKNFQTAGTTSASRAPIADVYNFIVQDLKDAITTLPASPKTAGVLPGKATAAAAKHLLAKVYLTRAGSSAKQATDYQDAYNTANSLITTASGLGLGLLPDYGKVFAEGNEDNSEVLWTVQHTSNIAFNGPTNSGGGGDNVLNHMWIGQYEKRPGMIRDIFYGRPYIRCVPTRWLTDTTFKERINDSRYSKSFQTVWIANNPDIKGYPVWPATLPAGAPANAVPGQPKFKLGDTAIYMPGVDVSDAKIAATRYLLIPPRKYDNTLAPTLMKYFDSKRPDLNAPSVRPVIVYRLAETYLIAAEAAYMLSRATDAVPLINTVRERAAIAPGNIAAMDIKASDLSLDFILDERTRELCGENMRWLDLVRTNKLIERVKLHNPEAAPNIQPKHVLRPIPQSQIDATTTGETYPQNPGW